jgi:hypothetical protein
MKKIALITLIFSLSAGFCIGQTELKYYGVDDIDPDEFAFLKDSLGGNFGMVELSTDTLKWKKALAEAEKYDLKIIIWPLGNGHQWTPWAWDGSSWDISAGLNVLKYAEAYTIAGGQSLLAIVMSHEPFYNNGDPFTASEMKMLYSALKNEAPHVQLFVYMNDMAYYDKRPNTKIEDGIMDIAGIWLHCFGEAEGTCEESLQEIEKDYALIQEKGLKMQLFFAIQTFGIKGTKYIMPTAAEMRNFATSVFDLNKLDGIFWYPWNQVASDYTSWLSKDRYDSMGEDRWDVVRQFSPFLTSTEISANEEIERDFTLSQNYPNPFHSSTIITFNAYESGLYTMKLFNLLGQQLTILFNNEVTPGSYTVNLNSDGMQPGIYIYTLQNNYSLLTKRLIVL